MLLPWEIDHRQGGGDAQFFWHARVSQTHGQAGPLGPSEAHQEQQIFERKICKSVRLCGYKDNSDFASLKALLVLNSSVKRQKDLKARFLRQS